MGEFEIIIELQSININNQYYASGDDKKYD